jgi:hypothetical protein
VAFHHLECPENSVTREALMLAISAAMVAATGCADQPAKTDPEIVTLRSGIIIDARGEDRDRIVDDAKQCEAIVDSFGAAAHPGRSAAESTISESVIGGLMYGLSGASAAAGAALGAIGGALGGGAPQIIAGTVPGERMIIRNCMAGMGHKALN